VIEVVCADKPADGEGSAREHAALQPRFYGCGMIVARSFARIHETNLKKQGILPLWLSDKSTYGQISAHDKVQTIGMEAILDGSSTSDKVVLRVTKPSGEVVHVECRHTLSADQVEWLRAGSALNWIGEVARRKAAEAAAAP
jgi:aconitase A